MSVYDRYFSKQNKNYIFSVLSDLIKKEVGVDIHKSPIFIELYKDTYPFIFEKTTSDNLSDINKLLIDEVGSQILSKLKYSQNPVTHKNTQSSQLSIYSSDRLNNSKHKYNFLFKIDKQISKLIFNSILIPQESNILFSFPTIYIKYTHNQDSHYLLCHLLTTKCFGNRDYIEYSIETNEIDIIDHILTIEYLDYMKQEIPMDNDILSIKKLKSIVY